ncbi:Apolipoprotein D [Ooceraea biroi]|uniref:Apolipoprotein D n=1 Tax=Ooceraea biroi TaxID=2015173 RepID=A0A026X1L2_OOCBI|nr:Apolipoprotein D [Ooceraea biroi]
MFGKIVLVLSGLAWASAQVPSLGFCPEYIPMVNFNMQRFMGVWYEAEKYFQLNEVVSRCVMTNYTKGIDGKYRVSNQVTSRFTGIKRILEGEIRPPASKAEEGKIQVKYTTVPLTPETKYSVLETDYNSYAVLWSCQGLGPVNTQNAWVMTRERIPSGEVLQKAYGVLDKYKISKTFFVRTDQTDCAYLEAPPVEQPTTEKPKRSSTKQPTRQKPQKPTEADESYRSAIDQKDIDVEKKAEVEVPNVKATPISDVPKIIVEESVEPVQTAETVPERILKIAEAIKEEESDAKIEKEIDEVRKENIVENANEEKKKSMLRIFVIIGIVNTAMAQVPFLGNCPNLEAMQGFDLEKYLGKWYEVERYFAWFEFGGKCVTANYSLNEDSSMKIINKQISSLTGVASSIEGIGRLIGKSNDPKLTVTFPSLPLPIDAPYWVLHSDYNTYAVVWSCTNLGVLNTRNVWILTREPKPPIPVLEKAYQVIDKNNISRAYFIRTDQKNCPASY